MRAMRLETTAPIETSPLRLKILPSPHPGVGEVRIRVNCCAICRTDLHVIEGELAQRKCPIIPGHQAIGRIDELGSNCHRLKIGQRVGAAWLSSTCGQCHYCRKEKENLCPFSEYTGYTIDGGYAEYLIIREDFAYPIPAEFDDFTATPLLCSGIIGYRTLQRCNLPQKEGKLGIFGFGSAAHIVIQLAQSQNAKVYVVTRDQHHLEFATSLGATSAVTESRNLPELLDSAILFAPAGELVAQALIALDKGGTLAVGGIHLSPIPPLDYEKHLFYEKDLRSVTANTRQDGYSLLNAAAKIPIHPHIKTYPLESANEALQDLKADRIIGTAVLVCN
jgi:propanol-preferring alcohol dehydrogenase